MGFDPEARTQAVHDKYKAKHLAQMRAVQSYEERVVDQDR